MFCVNFVTLFEWLTESFPLWSPVFEILDASLAYVTGRFNVNPALQSFAFKIHLVLMSLRLVTLEHA